MKRHVHMLDLDRPSHPRLRKSACKDCKAREDENARLRAELAELREAVNKGRIILDPGSAAEFGDALKRCQSAFDYYGQLIEEKS